jgi:lipopolysaccharide export system permease protein
VSRFRPFVADRLDLYTLRQLVGPLALALGTLLLAQLLERLLRLFELVAASGAAISVVLTMAANLVPHYLGLALPTAFTAGIFMAVARLGDDNEVDIMLAAGRSIARLAMPFIAVAFLLCLFNLYLFGYLQPMSRYGYHVAVHEALNIGWNARMEDKRFVTAARGITLSADAVEPDGRSLRGVFIERREGDVEEITTAPRGRLVPSADGRELLLELEEGLIVHLNDDQSLSSVRFTRGMINDDFTPAPPPFRARGETVSELTLPELWRGMRGIDAAQPEQKMAAELHGRLVRTLVVLLLPLLAVPLGLASKRGQRAPGVVFAVLALLILNHSLQFGESLAESGRAAAAPALWIPWTVFGAMCLWIFRESLAWPGDNPVTRAVRAIEAAFEGFGRRSRPLVTK